MTIIRFLRNVVLTLFAGACLSAFASDAQSPANDNDESEIHALPGFKVEKIYTVPDEQGSWVSLAIDNKGRFIVSDQSGLLYRVAIPSDNQKPVVQPIKAYVKDEKGNPTGEPVGSAQGLAWAFDSLYVVVNGKSALGSGLYRLRTSSGPGAPGGSDELDTAERLAELPGVGEHCAHAVVPGPDGHSLYVVAGNDCGAPPAKVSRVPSVWGGDLLLSPQSQPTDWHTRNGIVPGGWICRADPDGKKWEVVCGGFRNSYRLAFNSEGELFTSDNDDEWQIGLPWYRAPRICHVRSGGDFGWRSLSYKWPPYYPDGLQAVVDLPRGAPSGLLFGTGAKFPEKYQRALFSLEWSFGKIYAIHLAPAGATYSGTVETFLSGKPLAITDAAIGKDGAMYFIIGGRSIQSCLYRVTYAGGESTIPVSVEVKSPAQDARELRRKMEALHEKKGAEAIEAAWPNLDNADPAIRFAARVALEHQNVKDWQDRLFKEERVQVRLTAAMALARCGEGAIENRLLEVLNGVEWQKLSEPQKIELLRDYALTFIRMGKPDAKLAAHLGEKLDALYPSKSDLIDRELAQLLVCLRAPHVVEKTLPLLRGASTQEGQIHLGNVLIGTKESWTPVQRKQYFEWLDFASTHYRGGREVFDLLADLQTQALASSPPDERKQWETACQKNHPQPAPPKARALVKIWTVDELLPYVKANLAHGDYQRGRQIYHESSCIKCHYFYDEGTEIGPDLTSVANRFNLRSILESIIEPSKVISDQWANKIVKTRDGGTLIGRILCETRNTYQYAPDPLAPDKFVEIDKANVASMKKSPVSIMPDNLLNTFTKDEIVDLMAFLTADVKQDSHALDAAANKNK